MSRDGENFLSRWSQRKQAAREEVVVEDAEASIAPEVADPEKTDAEILEELGLKDPDEMGEGDDFSGFMSGAIPERLRNRALRKLWLTNPVLANLDELVDYGEDFTDAATVVENLQTAYRVGKGFLRQEEIDAAKEAEDADEAVDSDEPAVADAEDDPAAAESEDAETPEAAFSSDGKLAENGEAAEFDIEPQEIPASETPSYVAPPPESVGMPRPRRMVFKAG